MRTTIKEIMLSSPVIPVMVIDKVSHAVPLANALVKGGITVLEVTLRTEVALESLTQIKTHVPNAVVGAGTIINTDTLGNAIAAGADFIVSPGTTDSIIDAALQANVPLLPGVANPSETMRLLERGITEMKFFPAEAAGGIAMLKSIGAPIPQITFCPTGGISQKNAKDYYDLPNVACIGGSWMCAANLIATENWQEITRLSTESIALVTGT